MIWRRSVSTFPKEDGRKTDSSSGVIVANRRIGLTRARVRIRTANVIRGRATAFSAWAFAARLSTRTLAVRPGGVLAPDASFGRSVGAETAVGDEARSRSYFRRRTAVVANKPNRQTNNNKDVNRFFFL